MRAAAALLTLVLSAWPCIGAAQGAAPAAGTAALDVSAPSWRQLTPAQRQALGPLEDRWDRMDPARRLKWLRLSAQIQHLSPDDRDRIRRRMSDWSEMTPDERARVRQRYQEASRLPSDERKAEWEAYSRLPDEERQRLAEQRERAERRPPAPAATPKPQTLMAPSAAAEPKQKLVPQPTPRTPRAVAPTSVTPGPGTTTVPVNRQAAPPLHQQPGQPKIAAQPAQVDPRTLLPRQGPQAASRPSPRAAKPGSDALPSR